MNAEAEEQARVNGEEILVYSFLKTNEDTGEIEESKIACGYHCTDEGNAQRFVARYHDKVKYCHEKREWYIWNGAKWAADTKNQVYELAKIVVRNIFIEVKILAEKNAPQDERRKLSEWAFKSESMNRIEAIVKQARSDKRIAVNFADFDANLNLVNFQNGTLEKSTRIFREHRPEDLLTMITAAPYDPLCESEFFFSTLRRALPDERSQIYLQRKLGSMLRATTQLKEWFLIYGKPFAQKSSVTQAIYAALGDYAKPFDMSLIQKSKHGVSSNASRPELAALEKVLIAWCEETPPGMVIDDAFIKNITSSGQKPVRDLYEKQRQVEFRASFVLETNDPPIFDISEEWSRDAIMERTEALAFLNTLPKERRDPEVLIKLTHDPNELTAALAFVVQGYFDREDYGIELPPEHASLASETFKAKVSPLKDFLDSEVYFDDGTDGGKRTVAETVRISVKESFERFKETADKEAHKLVKNVQVFNGFFKDLAPMYAEKADVKIEQRRFSFGNAWFNVRLVDKEAQDDSSGVPVESGSADDSVEVKQKAVFGETPLNFAQYYNSLHQKGYFATLLHSKGNGSRFPIFTSPDLEHYNRLLLTDGSESEMFESDLDEIIDDIENYNDPNYQPRC